MKVLQSGHFSRAVKRLRPQEKKLLDKAVKVIVENPETGYLRVGNLAGVRIYKFKVGLNEMLLAYKFNKTSVELLLAYGTHKNFYRNLKKVGVR